MDEEPHYQSNNEVLFIKLVRKKLLWKIVKKMEYIGVLS